MCHPTWFTDATERAEIDPQPTPSRCPSSPASVLDPRPQTSVLGARVASLAPRQTFVSTTKSVREEFCFICLLTTEDVTILRLTQGTWRFSSLKRNGDLAAWQAGGQPSAHPPAPTPRLARPQTVPEGGAATEAVGTGGVGWRPAAVPTHIGDTVVRGHPSGCPGTDGQLSAGALAGPPTATLWGGHWTSRDATASM